LDFPLETIQLLGSRRIELDPSGDAKVHVRNPEISHEAPDAIFFRGLFSLEFIGFPWVFLNWDFSWGFHWYLNLMRLSMGFQRNIFMARIDAGTEP
jgi:hypothetical protein